MMDEILVAELLKELGAKGAVAVTAAFSKMIDHVSVGVQNVYVASKDSLAGMISGIEVPVTANYVPLHGYLDGSLLFALEIDAAEAISDLLIKDLSSNDRALMKISSLKELANMVTSSVINVFSDLFSWKIVPSPSIYMMDSIESIVTFISSYPSRVSKESLVINFEIKLQDWTIPAVMLLLVEKGGIDTLFKRFFDPFGKGGGEAPKK